MSHYPHPPGCASDSSPSWPLQDSKCVTNLNFSSVFKCTSQNPLDHSLSTIIEPWRHKQVNVPRDHSRAQLHYHVQIRLSLFKTTGRGSPLAKSVFFVVGAWESNLVTARIPLLWLMMETLPKALLQLWYFVLSVQSGLPASIAWFDTIIVMLFGCHTSPIRWEVSGCSTGLVNVISCILLCAEFLGPMGRCLALRDLPPCI